MSSVDDLFIALRAMTFDEALQLSIEVTKDLPLGTSAEEKIKIADAELEKYGWSFSKLHEEYFSRRLQSKGGPFSKKLNNR